jgi:hypothetical protein
MSTRQTTTTRATVLTIALMAIAISGLTTIPATADVIVQYTFSNIIATTATPQPASSTNGNVTVGLFRPILDGVASAIPNSSTGMAFSASSGNAYLGYVKIVATVPGDDYWSFTVQAKAGKLITFDTLSFSWAAPSLSVGAVVAWDVRSSIDNYASSLGTQQTANPYPATGTKTIDISSLGQRNEVVEFRIYNYETSGNASGAQMRVDDVTINGSVSSCGTMVSFF